MLRQVLQVSFPAADHNPVVNNLFMEYILVIAIIYWL